MQGLYFLGLHTLYAERKLEAIKNIKFEFAIKNTKYLPKEVLRIKNICKSIINIKEN